MREPQPARPQPDHVFFEHDDFVMPVLGLCALCCRNQNASAPVMVGVLNRGRAKDVEGCQIRLPSGRVTPWAPGTTLPPGYGFLAELARLFGPEASFRESSGAELPMFAVTVLNGTMVCDMHNDARLLGGPK